MKTAAALDEGLKYVIPVDNPRQISRSEDGKLIHVIGMLQTDQVSKTSNHEHSPPPHNNRVLRLLMFLIEGCVRS